MPVIRADVALLGDQQTGKSSVVGQFFGEGQKQGRQAAPTMVPELHTKRIKIPDTGYQVELCVYDCPSHRLALPLAQRCIAECKFVMVAVNGQERGSVEGAGAHVRFFRDATTIERPKGILVQNYSFEGGEAVAEDELQVLAGQLGLLPARCSAASGRDVDVPFMMLAQLVYNIHMKSERQ